MPLTKKEIFDGLKEAKLNKLKAKSPLFRESPQPSPIREVPTDIPRQSIASPSDLAPEKTKSLRDRFSSVKEQISKSVDLFTGGIREATKVPDKEDPRLLQSIKLGGSGAKRAYESTATGVLGNIASIPKFLRYTGIDAGRSFEEKAEAWRDELKQEDPRFIDDLLSGVGSMATFYIPSSGAMSAANMIAGISPRLATAFGVTTMTILESGMEAGQSYDEAI